MAKRKRRRKKDKDADEELGKKFLTAFAVMFTLGVALFFTIWWFF